MELQGAVEGGRGARPREGPQLRPWGPSVLGAISWDPGNGDIEGRWGRSRRGAGNWHLFSICPVPRAGLALAVLMKSLLSRLRWVRFLLSPNRNQSSERRRAPGHGAADRGGTRRLPSCLCCPRSPGPARGWRLRLQRGWAPGQVLVCSPRVLCCPALCRHPAPITLRSRLCWSDSFSSLWP